MKKKRVIFKILCKCFAGILLAAVLYWLATNRVLFKESIMETGSRPALFAILATELMLFCLMPICRRKENRAVRRTGGKRLQTNQMNVGHEIPTPGPMEIKTKEQVAVPDNKSAEPLAPIQSAVRFSDIAGYEGTKRSIQFIVNCLQNINALDIVGAKLPAGILLAGPPGTGKTFMAKAVAGEAGVPFFSVSASSFMEFYVGQGPRNIRALYAAARAHSPCVVFIDEIDAIGGIRNSGETNSERRNTLNALLVELDGMTGNSGILTIAATNTPEDLDPALVRAGRFDRKVYMPLPDVQEREAILKIHCRNKQLCPDVDFKHLAVSTPGFSASMLASLANEAALHAAYCDSFSVSMADFEYAMFQIIMEGEQKKSTNEAERQMVAWHEAGHTLAIKRIANETVPKVTIIGSTSGAGGVTFRAEPDMEIMSKSAMEAQIKIAYAGRAAEEIYFGNGQDVTIGASSDIKKATGMIRQYISVYGMSDDIGMLNMDVLIGRHSADREIIDEAKKLSGRLYQEVLQFLKEHEPELKRIAQTLLEKETLFDKDIDELLF